MSENLNPIVLEVEEVRVVNAVSPTVDLSRTENGALVSIHDYRGTQTVEILDGPVGPQGPQGESGAATAKAIVEEAISRMEDSIHDAQAIGQTVAGYRDAAAQSASNAALSKDAAALSAQAAEQSNQSSSGYAQTARTQAENAAQSTQAASQSATAADTSARNAAQSATNAGNSAQAASQSAQAASQSATDAADSAQDAQDVLDSIPADYSTLSTDVTNLKRAVSELESLDNAPAIIDTASGAVASFTDGADDMPMKSLIAHIEPVQDLHGYDHPWPAGSGKNKFNTDFSDTTINGTAITKLSDGKVSTSGVPTSSFDFVIGAVTLPAGDYILNGCPAGGGVNKYRLQVTDFPVRSNLGQDDGSGVSFSLSKEMIVAVRVQIYTGASASLTFVPMIRIASETDATFAPYSNICPISGWTGVKVSRTGKNLANTTEWFSGPTYNPEIGATINPTIVTDVTDNGDGTFSFPNVVWKTRSIRVKVHGGITYRLSGTFTANNGYIGWVITDSNNVILQKTSYYGKAVFYDPVITTPADAAWIYMQFGDRTTGSVTTNIITTPQCELGSIATDYEPYQGQMLDITFPTEVGTVYGGTLDVTSGVLTVNKGIVDLGIRNWDYSGGCFYSSLKNLGAKNTEKNTVILDNICSQYRTHSYIGMSNFDVAYFQNACRIRDSRYTDKDSFKSAMSGVMYVFELATPVTYHLTPQEIRTLLGQNNIWADTGDSDVTYQADTKLYIDNKFTELQALILENIGG